MINKILFPETITYCLYEKTFTLKKGLRVSTYIKALNETNFHPFILLIEKNPETNNFTLDVIRKLPMSIWTEDQHMQFFKLCTLSYSTEERAFTLQAFIGLRIIIFLLMDIILAVIVLGLSFSVLISERNVVFLLFISLLFYLSLRPLIIPFQQEKFVLDKIITIGSQ